MKKSLLFTLLLILGLGIGSGLYAQTLEYPFSSAVNTFTPITGGTLLGTETSDDQRFLDPAVPAGASTTTGPGLDIGFNFTFNGAVFDRLAINNNGWISLGQSALTPSVNNASTSGYTPISSVVAISPDVLYNRISGLGKDLQAQAGSMLRLETIGTAPNRICVVQWLNYKKYGTAGAGDSFNFQIRLHETINKVSIVYGTMTSNATVGNMQVGLRGPLATDFNSRQGTDGWQNTTASGINTGFVVLSDLIFPVSGLTYSFSFPVADQPPNAANLVYPANGAVLVSPTASLNWMSGGGLPTGYRLFLGTNNPPTNIVNNVDLGAVNTYDPTPDFNLATTYYWKVIPYNSFGNGTNIPVWSFTTHGSPTITALPYNQAWDNVTIPDLPFDWTSIVQSTVTTSYVKTVTTSPNTAPNCLGIYNGADPAANIIAVGPPLAPSIDTNSVRVKFWAKGSAAYHLLIGVMTDPADPATFFMVQDVNAITNWNEYIVDLTPYTGTGKYIAIKHAGAANSQTIFVDGVSFEQIAPNDLACSALSGNSTPTVNTATTYTASIHNWGTAAQNTYTVKLFNANNVQLATANGVSVAPSQSVDIPLTWTPTVEGAVVLYAKVFLTGDINPTNDQSQNLNVLVMGAGTLVISIGDGTTTNTVTGVPTPYGTYYKNFRQQYLYTAAEMLAAGGIPGVISSVSFNVLAVNNCSPMPNYTIKLKSTQQTVLTATFEVGDYTQVLVQNNFLPVQGWNVHPLSAPFVWDGVSNLLVDIVTTLIPGSLSQNAQVYYTPTTGTNTSLRYQSDSIDASTSATGTLSVSRANIRFSLNVVGMGAINGTVTSGGNPVSGATVAINTTTFSTTTAANGSYNFPFITPGAYTVTASKLGFETRTLPITIVANQTHTLNFVLPASNSVNVTGLVVGSAAPTIGLADAAVSLHGALDYQATTNASGQFTVTGVLTGNTYTYRVVKSGYQDLTGSITIGSTAYNMGTLTMPELALPVRHLIATENTPQTQVALTWGVPGGTGGGGVEDFEQSDGGWVSSGYGDWEWADNYNVANHVDTDTFVDSPPAAAHSGTGMWGTVLTGGYANSAAWSYMRKTFDLAGLTNPVLDFWHYMDGYNTWDYGIITVNGNTVWGSSALAVFMPWQNLVVDLSAYAGQSNVEIGFEWYATATVSYSGWYIDDLYVGLARGRTISLTSPMPKVSAQFASLGETEAADLARTLRKTNTDRNAERIATRMPDRPLIGYKVWRLTQGNENLESTWTLLTTNAITDTIYTDSSWASLPDGNYKWAVKAIYTNNVMSVPTMSNLVRILRLDMAANSITGTFTPSVEMASTYTVQVENTGTTTQQGTAYTVKLMTGATQLVSVPGVTLAPGAVHDFELAWTPTTQGPLSIFGKVVLPGDTVPANNQTSDLAVTVQPAGTMTVTVGEGNLAEGIPFEFFYKCSVFETLYYPTEIGMYGNIVSLTFYNNFLTNLPDKPVKIWLGSTMEPDLSTAWIPSAGLTPVFNGTVTFPAGQNNVVIPLQIPYSYTGGNLVLLANRPLDTAYFSSSDNFQAQTIGTNRARKLNTDSVDYDPLNPSAVGTLSGTFPKTTFTMTPLSPDPMFAVSPPNHNFGQVLMGMNASIPVQALNVGGGTLTINSVTISGSPFFTLEGMPTLPANLATGQSVAFVTRFSPTAAGTHTATIIITDNLGGTRSLVVGSRDGHNRTGHDVVLTGTCIDPTIISLPYTQTFDDVIAPALPLTWSKLIQSTATPQVQTYTTNHSTPNSAGMNNSSDANATVLLIAPPLAANLPVNTTRVKFWSRSGAVGYPISIGVMTNPQDAATFTEIQSISLTATFTEYIVGLTGYTGTGRYIAFKHGLGGITRVLYVDDFLVELVAPNDLGAASITGNATPTVGLPSDYTVMVQNWGTLAQPTYSVKLMSGTTELASVAGPALNPGQILPVVVPWAPDTAGAILIYGKVVLTGDQNTGNDQTPGINLLVNPPGVIAITVGEGGSTARVPVDMFYRSSLFETIYTNAEMGNFIGMITGIQFYNSFTSSLTAKPTKVWIGTTTLTSLTDGWIPSTQMTQIFDGVIDYPSGQNIITIPLSTPYLYLNGENLVIMVKRPLDTGYHSSSDNFITQTIGSNRSREMHSDSIDYDPAAPTAGTLNGIFPKTTFMVIPGGVGDILGTVTGPGNVALEGVTVQLVNAGYTTTTNATGHYGLLNVLPNNYTISFSKYGYVTHTQAIVLAEDQELTVNATLQPMATVNVTGTILASDTGLGINGAAIHLTGYANYTANSIATGAFTVPAVYANQSYNYTILAPGYSSATGSINVGTTNHAMGSITLTEIAFAPGGVTAALNGPQTEALINWLAPDPNALEVTEGFEATTFPPLEWTQTILNTGAANSSGVFPTWCKFGTVTVAAETVVPTEGTSQGGLWWSYEHQDEWLITPGFAVPPNAYLSFDSYVFLGSTSGDHYYVKGSIDGGANWTVLWDASAQTGGWNYYASPISIDLASYSGQQLKLAWHAVDPPSNDGLWYVWFIDDIYIGNATTRISFSAGDLTSRGVRSQGWQTSASNTHPSRAVENGMHLRESVLPQAPQTQTSTRSLVGYKVWRLASGQEANQDSWTLLTPENINTITFTDPGWASLANGNYRWAVKAVYTSNVISLASFSNILTKEIVTGMISGVVRRLNNQPIPGATITAGTHTATCNNSGAYVLILPTGIYTVTASMNDYVSGTVENVVVNANQTTTVNFIIVGVGIDDEVIPATITALLGNYPNPFNPSTTISYSVKDPSPVKLVIYNMKGQKIKTLIDQNQTNGRYNAVWNGKDDNNNAVGSGVYYYRMSAGKYISTRKMLLVE